MLFITTSKSYRNLRSTYCTIEAADRHEARAAFLRQQGYLFHTQHAFDAGTPSEFSHNISQRNTGMVGYQAVKKFEDMFIRFHRMHERDRQIDGQPAAARLHR